MSLDRRWADMLARLHEQGRYRSLRLPSGLDFSSNDYLGYASGRLPISTNMALSLSGAASRLLRGQHAVWEGVETRLAHWHGAEAALVFPSGYAANEGLLSTVISPRDWVASDRLNHACIQDGLRLSGATIARFRHNDLDDLRGHVRSARELRKPEQELFIVTESLFSMDGDRAPLPEIATIAQEFEAHLIVDEAHATGCLGPQGSGLVNAVGLRSHVLATTHTGGKALGVPGAYVVGSTTLKEILVNRCRHFLFTTALPPAIGSWWLQAIDRARSDDVGRSRLQENIQYIIHGIQSSLGPISSYDQIIPIILGDDKIAVRAAEHLQLEGFDIRAIRPPTVPEGTARLRISIHADHMHDQLRQLAELLKFVVRP